MRRSAHGGDKARASSSTHLAPFAGGGLGVGAEVMRVAHRLRAATKAVVRRDLEDE